MTNKSFKSYLNEKSYEDFELDAYFAEELKSQLQETIV